MPRISYIAALAAALMLAVPTAMAQETVTQGASPAAPPAGDVSSEDPLVNVMLAPIHEQLAEHFAIPEEEEMVNELKLPVELAAGVCEVEADTLSGDSATCEATVLTPELIAHFEEGPDAESDGIPDTLLLPPDGGQDAAPPA